MKKTLLVLFAVAAISSSQAQTDTTVVATDTAAVTKKKIRIGNIIIVKEGDANDTVPKINKKPSRISTSYFTLDLGLSNFSDATNYGSANSYLVNNPAGTALSQNDFKLRTGKSINVNLWFITQEISLIKQNVGLKYALGLELNNYRYKQPISYSEGGPNPFVSSTTPIPGAFVFRDTIVFEKNKLAADYVTVPLMLTLATNGAANGKGISLGAGVSAGYLYSQRNKQVSDARGKQKNKGDYDLERFKLSFVGELGIGKVKLYGSYSPKSMYQRGLDMKPYNIGIRVVAK